MEYDRINANEIAKEALKVSNNIYYNQAYKAFWCKSSQDLNILLSILFKSYYEHMAKLPDNLILQSLENFIQPGDVWI